MTEFIGRGERTVKAICKHYFPRAKITTQVPLHVLVGHLGLSQRQEKESIDIVVYTDKFVYGVRVNGKDHKGYKAIADKHQKDIMKICGIKVVDIDWQDCPNVFKDLNNKEAYQEVGEAFGL